MLCAVYAYTYVLDCRIDRITTILQSRRIFCFNLAVFAKSSFELINNECLKKIYKNHAFR